MDDKNILKIGHLYKFVHDQHPLSVWDGNTRYYMGYKDDIFLIVSGLSQPYANYITIMFNGVVGEIRRSSLLTPNIICISNQEQ